MYNALCSTCAVTLQTCGPCDSRIEFVPQQLGLVDTAVTVVNLLPYVNYTFRVEAVNGVSDLSPAPRMYVEITVAISEGGVVTPRLNHHQASLSVLNDRAALWS
eukprot:g41103.t1